MAVLASAEFRTLCQLQVASIAPGLGGSSSAVYLTEPLAEGDRAQLIPIAAAPEERFADFLNSLTLEAGSDGDRPTNLALPKASPALPALPGGNSPGDRPEAEGIEDDGVPDYHMVLPLSHDSAIIGLLVANRSDRPWSDGERHRLEEIARTIVLSYVLERRSQWFEARYSQLHETERQRRSLLDDILHQFRNPLTTLQIFGKLLLDRLQPGKENDLASNMVRESRRLQELAEQFDRALELQTDGAALPAAENSDAAAPLLLPPGNGDERCDPNTVLTDLLASARAVASDRRLHLRDRLPEALPSLPLRPEALREAVGNLLDNALKYTPSGGCVCLEAAGFENEVAIAISDTGPGIPAEDRDRLFERRYRGVQSDGDIPGTGLGLAIARQLIRDAGGEIEVFSPARPFGPCPPPENSAEPRPGTTFVARLPAEGDLKT